MNVTNRKFLSDLTRGQLLSLAVQKANLTISYAVGLGDTKLRELLETVKNIQEPEQA